MSNTINADDGIISGIAGLKYSADTSGALVLQTNGTTAITISASQAVTFAGAVSLGALTTSGNLTFTGTGNRILGDFSNGTLVNRVSFQTSTTNSATSVQAIPNGTSTTSTFLVSNATDVDNSSIFQFQQNSVDSRINANKLGTGSYLPITMYTGGSERMRIDTSGNVGIGTSSPATRLHVYSGSNPPMRVEASIGASVIVFKDSSTGATLPYVGSIGNNTVFGQFGGAESMRIDSSGNVGIGTTSPAFPLDVVGAIRSNSWIGRANVSVPTADCAVYRAADNTLAFSTSSTERMRIDSSGNALFGKTNTATIFAGAMIYGSLNAGAADFTRDGGRTLYLNRITSTGTLVEFAQANNIVGGIDVTSTGTTYTGTNGVRFTGTQAASGDANTLDDYEEGTFTPTLKGTGSDPTVTYQTRQGKYTKIGRMVYCEINIEITALSGGSGQVTISIPFTATTGVDYQPSYPNIEVLAIARAGLMAMVPASNTTVNFWWNNGGAAGMSALLYGTDTTSGLRFRLSFCYTTT